MIISRRSITNSWFYSEPHPILRLLTIYVNGDMLVIIPLLLCIGLLGFISVEFMAMVYAIFFAMRHFGEMIYWFSHQFWEKKYRPDDFGFVNLSNDAVYILYQLMSLAATIFWIAIVLLLLRIF
ncbi:MAG: hypothetical protein UZ22_OP11002000690 [Microgenomates bacterium OLB23]|nr:MAG: hypothetical protein UZ22_OP11002000690 [Microgenomates bacterium OLB23]